MKTTKLLRRTLSLFFIIFPVIVFAQATEEDIKQANNPLAKIKTFNVHNYYIPSMYGSEDLHANQTMLRYAQPIGNVLVRATLPFETLTNPAYDPAVSDSKKYYTGLSDLQIFAAYVFPIKNIKGIIGAGPLFVAPTATETELGEGKWQAGLSFIAFMPENPLFQYGALITWQISFAGDDDKKDVDRLIFQPFGMWQIGGGVYVRSAPFWTFDLEDGGINIPFSLGIGKVTKVQNLVFNLFIEPQYSAINYKYDNGARFQLFSGINMQF